MTDKTKATDRSEEVFELRRALEERDREIASLNVKLEKATSQAREELGTLRKLTRGMTAEILQATQTIPLLDSRAVPEIVEAALQNADWHEGSDGRLYGKAGSVLNWLQAYKASKPFFFADYTTPVGSAGRANGTAHSAGQADDITPELLKIFDPKTMNLTMATEIEQKNPELAARVAAQVGNKIFMSEPARRFGR